MNWDSGTFLALTISQETWEPLARLLLALVAGAVLGWERERQDKPAGLRTHMLVALGSTAFVVATLEYLAAASEQVPEQVLVNWDPIRVVAGIVGGIGFLGAGSIIEARGSVQGITTAASIWVTASIGVASGFGLYKIAVSTVVLALLVLVALGLLERRLMTPQSKP